MHRNAKTGRGHGQATVSLILALLASSSLLAISWLLLQRPVTALSDIRPDTATVISPIIPSSIDYSTDIVISGQIADGGKITGTALIGTVSEVAIAPGSNVTAGQLLYRVDDQPVFAYTGETALYRDLELGTRGEDVRIAQATLSKISGKTARVDGNFGRSTQAAVNSFQKQWLGQETPNGVFPHSNFARTPAQSATVEAVSVFPGMPAPSQGEDIALLAPTVTSISLAGGDSVPDGTYILSSEGAKATISRKEQTWDLEGNLELGALLLGRIVDPAATSITIEARIALAEPLSGALIPGSSLLHGHEGSFCILTDPAGTDAEISVIDERPDGTVVVDLRGSTVDKVVVNPDSIQDAVCR